MKPTAGPDKWELLQALTDAADHFELSHRTLGVLKALLTFHPERMIPQDAPTIVFASNRALSQRLSGMPESTLRRHIAKLIQTGIVSRHDSPNKKRYARRVGNDIAIAFGFDLAPFARLNAELMERASEAQQHREYLQVLRTRLMALRDRLLNTTGAGPVTDEAALLLRRKPKAQALLDAIETLNTLVDNPTADNPTVEELSSTDSQNERHIQYSDEYVLNSEPQAQEPVQRASRTEATVTLQDVLGRCTAFASFFPEKVRDWLDLNNIAHRLSRMMGIDQPVFDDARRTMGQEQATVVILCMLERLSKIREAGAYLRVLTKKASMGQFQVIGMLNAVGKPEIVS